MAHLLLKWSKLNKDSMYILFWQKFHVAGGDSFDATLKQVLITEDGQNWNETGTMKYARSYAGASLVPREIKNYCKTPKL